jgi:homoserine dehydrogenase
LAQIARTLGDHNISIASAIQKQADMSTRAAEIVIMTHPAREKEMQQAFSEFKDSEAVREISNFVRVEE